MDYEEYADEAWTMADVMRKAAGTDNPREIFFAAAILMSWALCTQSKELRQHAVGMALDMIEDGHVLFGKGRPLDS